MTDDKTKKNLEIKPEIISIINTKIISINMYIEKRINKLKIKRRPLLERI